MDVEGDLVPQSGKEHEAMQLWLAEHRANGAACPVAEVVSPCRQQFPQAFSSVHASHQEEDQSDQCVAVS